MINDFCIGDRVLMTAPEDDMMADCVGTIICEEGFGLRRYGVDFGIEECDGCDLHDLDGHLPHNTGWYVSPSRLQLVERCALIDVEDLI